MNEFNKNWLKLALEYKDNSDVTFNLSQNDIRILLTYIEILQSKIDKAIEYAKDNLPERDYMGCLLTDEDVTLNMILEKLLDILKEDK